MPRRPKRPGRTPAIVPRFLKGLVTVGAIPSLAAACSKPAPRVQPVVAQYVQPPPPVVAAYAPDAGPERIQPVVAAYVRKPTPIAADAAIDAPPGPQGALTPVVDSFRPPPAVVAAYVPRDEPTQPEPPQPKPKTKSKKKP